MEQKHQYNHDKKVVTETVTKPQSDAVFMNTALLVITLLLSGISAFFAFSAYQQSSQKELTNAFRAYEEQKIGKEAYQVRTELEKLLLQHPQNPENLDKMKAYLKQLKEHSPSDTMHDAHGADDMALDSATLSQEDRDAILNSAPIEGNKNADVVFVEYADLECPFCIMQHNENQISKKIKEEFGDKVAYIFKNHRGVDHRGTEVKALGALCAQKVGGVEAYAKFYSKVFEKSTTSSYYPVAELPALAKELGLDTKAWQSCVDNKELLSQFEKETAEAQKYGLRGTPGVLIFNKKTGAYTTIIGAQQYENFAKAVNSLQTK